MFKAGLLNQFLNLQPLAIGLLNKDTKDVIGTFGTSIYEVLI